MEAIGLYQLNSLVKRELKNRFPDSFLVIAEIADVKENRSGHCYLELAETKMKYVDPKNILEKGFSITRINGKAVRETDRVKKGDVLETELFKGVIRSEIKDIETNI